MFKPKAPKKIAAASLERLPSYPPNVMAELLSTIEANKEIMVMIRNHQGSLKNNL
jgi:hypothetical protein